MANWYDLPAEIKELVFVHLLRNGTVSLQPPKPVNQIGSLDLLRQFGIPLGRASMLRHDPTAHIPLYLLSVSRSFLTPGEFIRIMFLPGMNVTIRAIKAEGMNAIVEKLGARRVSSLRVLKLGSNNEGEGINMVINLGMNMHILKMMPRLRKLHLSVGPAKTLWINPCGEQKGLGLNSNSKTRRGHCECGPMFGLDEPHLRGRIPTIDWTSIVVQFIHHDAHYDHQPRARGWTKHVISTAIKRTRPVEVQLEWTQEIKTLPCQVAVVKKMRMSTKDWVARTEHEGKEVRFPQIVGRNAVVGFEMGSEAHRLFYEMLQAYNGYAEVKGCYMRWFG